MCCGVLLAHPVVGAHAGIHVSLLDHPSPVEQDARVADVLDGLHVVAGEQHSPPGHRRSTHLGLTLLLEGLIANRKDLINQHDLRLKVCGDGKRQAHEHAARVVPYGRVNEVPDLRKGDDLILTPLYLDRGHADHRAAQQDVLPAAQVWMEARANLEESAHATLESGGTLGWCRDPGEDAQKRALARAVTSDYSHDPARFHAEGNTTQRPDAIRHSRHACGSGLITEVRP